MAPASSIGQGAALNNRRFQPNTKRSMQSGLAARRDRDQRGARQDAIAQVHGSPQAEKSFDEVKARNNRWRSRSPVTAAFQWYRQGNSFPSARRPAWARGGFSSPTQKKCQ